MADVTLEALLAEGRTFPPPAGLRRRRPGHRRRVHAEADADPEGFWAGQAGELLDWYAPLAHRPRVGAAVREVVRRRHAQRLVQLPRPPRRRRSRRPGRVPLGGRARRHPHHHLRASCSTTSPQLANALKALGVEQGRPGHHLPRHGARAADRDARVRAHRRRALRRLRRLLLRLAARPHQRRRGEGAHHRRRRVAARQRRPAQGDRRRRGGRDPVDREGARAAAHRARRRR